ncbi:hypothetical protein DB31_7193 [Hyalangium minutum]|uniref:Uncharacterized protein n=1 Tax=Hyalangium minutum TaxID=394096 RepID=A0A085WJU3_9BACT|nr:hypothetical protein DB31_7193 [Hyalangium minutum]
MVWARAGVARAIRDNTLSEGISAPERRRQGRDFFDPIKFCVPRVRPQLRLPTPRGLLEQSEHG